MAKRERKNPQKTNEPERQEQEERISHFRPGYDFTRISILNTFLTLIALIYFIPKRMIKKIIS